MSNGGAKAVPHCRRKESVAFRMDFSLVRNLLSKEGQESRGPTMSQKDTQPAKTPPPRPRGGFHLLILIGALWGAILARDYVNFRANVETIPYSQFLSLLESKEVKEVGVGQSYLRG